MVGVPSFLHSHRLLTPILNWQFRKYLSERENIFLFYAPSAYQNIKEKNLKEKYALGCTRILILKILKCPWCDIAIDIVILHDLNPLNLTDQKYE